MLTARLAAGLSRVLATRTGALAAGLLIGLVLVTQFMTLEMKSPIFSEGWFAERAWSLVFHQEYFGATMWPDVAERQVGAFGICKSYLAIVGVCFRMFGVGLWQMRLVPLFSGALVLVLLVLLGRRLFDTATGLLAAVFVATLKFFQFTLDTSRPEMLIAGYTLLALYLLAVYRQKPRPLWLFAAGAVSALTLDLHLNALPVPVAVCGVVAYWLGTRRMTYGAAVPLVGGLGAAFGLWYVANVAIYDPQYFVTMVLPAASGDGGTWGLHLLVDKATKLANYFVIRNTGGNVPELLVLVLGAVQACRWRRLTPDEKTLVVWLGVAVPLTALYNKTFYLSHLATLLPVAYLLCAGFFVRISGGQAVGPGQRIYLLVFMVALTWHVALAVKTNLGELRHAADTGRQFTRMQEDMRRYIPGDAVVLGQPAYWFAFAGQQYYPGQFYMSRVGTETGELVNDTGHRLDDAARLAQFKAFLYRRHITHIIDCDYFGAALRQSYTPAILPADEFQLLGTVGGNIRIYRVGG